ncbi:unnamed protein product [Mytilus edulis]|uniref:Uncharacterized protein n=1 Tax=Mytilus edulis TaxID=6550 RepID=A0A8S3V5C2_MYTED|nr:unnamed protein product [Mytilus edulis]
MTTRTAYLRKSLAKRIQHNISSPVVSREEDESVYKYKYLQHILGSYLNLNRFQHTSSKLQLHKQDYAIFLRYSPKNKYCTEIIDREDRRRFFVIGSVILEVVTPVFRRQLENNYTKAGFSCLQDFLNNQQVVHTLFHLNHRYTWYCCVDSTNCIARQKLPLNNYQWNLLYTENPGPGKHHCHCKYTAKPVKLEDLDITLMGLILVNCFTLGPAKGCTGSQVSQAIQE